MIKENSQPKPPRQRGKENKMVSTTQRNIFGQEHYAIFINGEFFAEFLSIAMGEEIAQAISTTLFHKPANH